MTTCPFCGEKIPPRGLLCSVHWLLVPAALRAKVSGAFDPTRLPEEQSEAYLRAAGEATRAAGRAIDRLQVVPRLVSIAIPRPWAWLVATGAVPVHARPYPAPPALLGQRVAIVASTQIDREGAIAARQHAGVEATPDAWAFGVIAVATLDRCVAATDVKEGDPADGWLARGYGWSFREVVAFPPVTTRTRDLVDLQCLPDAIARRAWYRRLVGLARADVADPIPAGTPPIH